MSRIGRFFLLSPFLNVLISWYMSIVYKWWNKTVWDLPKANNPRNKIRKGTEGLWVLGTSAFLSDTECKALSNLPKPVRCAEQSPLYSKTLISNPNYKSIPKAPVSLSAVLVQKEQGHQQDHFRLWQRSENWRALQRHVNSRFLEREEVHCSKDSLNKASHPNICLVGTRMNSVELEGSSIYRLVD